MDKNPITEIAIRFAYEIEQEVRRQVYEEMVAFAGKAAARHGDMRVNIAHRRALVPTSAAASVEEVLAFIATNPKSRTEHIAQALGKNVRPALVKLRASGQVKTRGIKRAMVYTVAQGSTAATAAPQPGA